ncbi:hypothetical protein C468_00210 [Halorubrum kocurii JCM 14978]|uniref:Uncharacterized protein n=1 Tax=Halorubrum kocurii JCM 14978 TaxID=1230456 RepID=M0PNB8_9EURY|nr:hypothetical protein C468_00210 [Halorubrum kocurii JCM 14978]
MFRVLFIVTGCLQLVANVVDEIIDGFLYVFVTLRVACLLDALEVMYLVFSEHGHEVRLSELTEVISFSLGSQVVEVNHFGRGDSLFVRKHLDISKPRLACVAIVIIPERSERLRCRHLTVGEGDTGAIYDRSDGVIHPPRRPRSITRLFTWE